MKVEELMIGDWVYLVKDYGKPKKDILKIDTLDLHRVSDGVLEVEPIPLTTDILEKNGFIKSTPPPGIHAKCYNLDNKVEKYHLTIANYNKYKRLLLHVDSEDSECFNIKCDYVHELQHALRLCGIRKEIIV